MDKIERDDNYVPRVIMNHVQNSVMIQNKIPTRVVEQAVGYLSCWASHSYKTCIISHDGNTGDLIASYWKSDKMNGKPDYVIGAVYHNAGYGEKEHYSFHS